MTFLKAFVKWRTGAQFAFASLALTVLGVPVWLLMFSTVILWPPPRWVVALAIVMSFIESVLFAGLIVAAVRRYNAPLRKS